LKLIRPLSTRVRETSEFNQLKSAPSQLSTGFPRV
jgi:hypothetical protein